MNRILKFSTRFLSIFLTLVVILSFATASKAQAACSATQPGGLSGSIIITGCVTGETVSGWDARGPAPSGVTNDGGCVGYTQNQTRNTYGNGTYTPSPAAGQCHQIDITVAGRDYGVAKYGGGTNGGAKVCGESCTTSADCIKNSGTGAPVACVAGKCANTACAAGMTVPGLNCTCGANARLCGQTCSGALGLCAAGQGTCTYVNGPNCGWGTTTYCARDNNGYKHAVCTAGDAPGGNYLVTAGGKSAGLTAAEIAASCQVCGNGDQEAPEQCDHGPNNGKPGDMCDSNCKVVACNQICKSQADCGGIAHVVNFKLRGAGDIVIDYIKDQSIFVELAPPLTFSGGAWQKNTDSAPMNGSYWYGAANGLNVSYTTYSSSLFLRTFASSQRGIIDVYVDNVLKTSITDLKTGTAGWRDVFVLVSTPYTYTCTPIGATSQCRMTANPGDVSCGTVPTPAPSPTTLVCDLTPTFTSSGSNASAWKYGDMITFTAGVAQNVPAGNTVRYEGEVKAYRGTTAVKSVTLVPINATASQFQPMKVDVSNSTYYFRFRYCSRGTKTAEVCTNWGEWAAP